MLTDRQIEAYARDGYLQLPGWVEEPWLSELRAASDEFVEQSRSLTSSNRLFDFESGHTAEALRRLVSPVDVRAQQAD